MHIDTSYKAVHGQYSTKWISLGEYNNNFHVFASHHYTQSTILMEKISQTTLNQMHSILKYNIEFII